MRTYGNQTHTFMNTSRRFGALVIAVLTLSFAAGQVIAANNVTDEQIGDAVERELMLDDSVSAHLIDVYTSDGIVTLNGSVSHLLAEQRAETIARSVKGVRSVVNELNVRPVSRDDAAIKADITSALISNPVTESFEIVATVQDGIATLTGTVDSWAEKEIAVDTAKRVKGLRGVKNNIVVDYGAVRPDSEIAAEVKHRLENDVYVDREAVDVNVANGKVRLSGIAGSAEERQHARRDAWVIGVSSVDVSDLEVKPWTKDRMLKQGAVEGRTESQIEAAVVDALSVDPRVNSFDINVEVQDGTAMLDGVVNNLEAKLAAAEDARNTAGVWGVDNEIKVRSEIIFDDSDLERKIANALARDVVVERYEIGVDVRNQKASLYGTVDTFYEKAQAEEVVSRVAGVVMVDNNIDVEYEWNWQEDREIREEINDEMFWSPFVDSDQISVTVSDGVATLTGTADSLIEFNAAIENAFEGGAKAVKTFIEGRGVNLPEYNYPMYESFWSSYVE